MKKVLVAGAALMLAGGIASTASFAADEPGIKITGDARVRFYYADDGFRNFGNTVGQKSQTNLDSRVRLTFKGTAAGGSYAVVRMRIAESNAGDVDADYSNSNTFRNGNIVADQAYIGIPFTKDFTVELGRYRSTYGPLPGGPTGNNFFYDDVNLTGARGIIKIGDNVVINPFVEYMNEAQNADEYGTSGTGGTGGVGATNVSSTARNGLISDSAQDNDTYRFGVHAKVKVNKDWTVGGMLGGQVDNRNERLRGTGFNSQYAATSTSTSTTTVTNPVGGTATTTTTTTTNVALGNGNVANTADLGFQDHTGMFGSLYVNGKSGNFGIVGEIAFTSRHLNNWNSWEMDYTAVDRIGSKDTGFGGYILPNIQIDKLNLALLLGFTQNGFQPDGSFGDGVMLGTIDNSVISEIRIGDYGDWLFAGLIASYQIRDDLKVTGNFIYADINQWESVGPDGDGPNTQFRNLGSRRWVTNGVLGGNATTPGAVYRDAFELNNAWTISGILQYTISKGMDVFFTAGYLKPSIDDIYGLGVKDDGVFAAATRFELKF